MTSDERNLICDRLQSSLQLLFEEIEALTHSQWRFKPSERAWSIAQCVEHLAEVEGAVNDRIQALLLEGYSDPKLCAEAAGKDRLIGKAVPSRNRHAEAPQQPAGSQVFATPEPAGSAFKDVRARTLQFAQSTQHDLEKYVTPHFVFGQLNIFQWLFMLSLHCERHLAQIKEVKAAPAFPQA